MGRGAQPDNRAAAFHVAFDVRHFLIGKVQETGEDEEQVGFLQRREAGDAGGAGLDETVLVHAEDDRAFESEALCEDSREGRAGFLGAVFVIAGEEDDVLADAWAGIAFIDNGGGLGGGGGEGRG